MSSPTTFFVLQEFQRRGLEPADLYLCAGLRAGSDGRERPDLGQLMPSRFLADRAAGLVERMDDPNCDPEQLRRTYAQFNLLNRFVAGWGRIYSRYIRPELRAGATSILDVGPGGGDIARMLYRSASADGLPVRITAIDTDNRAVQFMQSSTTEYSIEVRHAGTRELLAAGERFDIVLSSNVLHHIVEDCIPAFLGDSHALAARLTIHSDIRRDVFAFLAFFPARFLFPGSFVAADGLISIRKSYRCEELLPLLPVDWDIRRMSPFRYLCMRRA